MQDNTSSYTYNSSGHFYYKHSGAMEQTATSNVDWAINTTSPYTGQTLSNGLNIDASRSSKAYGAGGSQVVRPSAFGVLASVYLGA